MFSFLSVMLLEEMKMSECLRYAAPYQSTIYLNWIALYLPYIY